MSSKPTRVFSTSGALAGVAVPFDLQELAGEGFSATYTEIHNLHPTNSYVVTIQGSNFTLPALRALRLPSFINVFSINGTGNYSVLAGDNPAVEASQTALPSLSEQTLPASVVSAVTPDNVTLENVGPVTQVKDAGISGTKIAPGAVGTINLNTGAVTYPKLGVGSVGDPGDTPALLFSDVGIGPGQTLTLTYGGTPVVYEFNFVDPVNANVHVDLATMPTSLATAIMANQAPLVAFAGGTNTWIGAPDSSNVQAGATLTGASTAGTVEVVKAAAASAYCGVEHYRVTLSALTSASGFAVFSPGTIYGYQIMCTRAAGTMFPNTGGSVLITGGGKSLYVSTLGAGGVAGDFVDVTLFVNY